MPSWGRHSAAEACYHKKMIRCPRWLGLVAGVTALAFASERDIALNAVVEGVDMSRGVMRIDAYDVSWKGVSIRGDIRRPQDVRPGHFANARGSVQSDGTVKARSLRIRKNNPGVSYRGRLERMSAKAVQSIEKDGKVVTDEALVSYVSALGARMVPDWARENIRFEFRVMEHPEINAFAMPGGQIYVFTGLLGRVENEAQFASIMGHEIAHVTHRHSERTYKTLVPTQFALITASVLWGGSLSGAEAEIANLIINASVSGYGRAHEDQSDRVGLRYLVDSGYDPREAPKVWDIFNAVYGDTDPVTNFFYSNHSTNKVRKRNQERELALHYRNLDYDSLVVTEDAYQQRMVDWTLAAAEHDFKKGRKAVARTGFERVLRLRPDDEKAKEYLAKLGGKPDGPKGGEKDGGS